MMILLRLQIFGRWHKDELKPWQKTECSFTPKHAAWTDQANCPPDIHTTMQWSPVASAPLLGIQSPFSNSPILQRAPVELQAGAVVRVRHIYGTGWELCFQAKVSEDRLDQSFVSHLLDNKIQRLIFFFCPPPPFFQSVLCILIQSSASQLAQYLSL